MLTLDDTLNGRIGLYLINKGGTNVYHRSMTDHHFNSDKDFDFPNPTLMSGFVTAINSFGTETMGPSDKKGLIWSPYVLMMVEGASSLYGLFVFNEKDFSDGDDYTQLKSLCMNVIDFMEKDAAIMDSINRGDIGSHVKHIDQRFREGILFSKETISTLYLQSLLETAFSLDIETDRAREYHSFIQAVYGFSQYVQQLPSSSVSSAAIKKLSNLISEVESHGKYLKSLSRKLSGPEPKIDKADSQDCILIEQFGDAFAKLVKKISSSESGINAEDLQCLIQRVGVFAGFTKKLPEYFSSFNLPERRDILSFIDNLSESGREFSQYYESFNDSSKGSEFVLGKLNDYLLSFIDFKTKVVELKTYLQRLERLSVFAEKVGELNVFAQQLQASALEHHIESEKIEVLSSFVREVDEKYCQAINDLLIDPDGTIDSEITDGFLSLIDKVYRSVSEEAINLIHETNIMVFNWLRNFFIEEGKAPLDSLPTFCEVIKEINEEQKSTYRLFKTPLITFEPRSE